MRFQKASTEFDEAIAKYLTTTWHVNDDEEVEHLIAGVRAFIAVNLWDEPYIPVIGVEQYEDKKWWQIWK